MQDDTRKLILTETALAVAVNVVLSIFFVLLVFHTMRAIPAEGMRTVLFDSLPQTFLISLMTVFVPTVMLRRRRMAGKLPWLPALPGKPKNVLPRALGIAAVAVVLGFALNAFLLPTLFPAGMSFAALLVYKAVYGGAVGAIIPSIAIPAELK